MADTYLENLRRLWTIDNCVVLFGHVLAGAECPLALQNRPMHDAEEDDAHCSVFRVLVAASENELGAFEVTESAEDLLRSWRLPREFFNERSKAVERIDARCSICTDNWLIPAQGGEAQCGHCYLGKEQGGIDWSAFQRFARQNSARRRAQAELPVNWLRACIEQAPRVAVDPDLLDVLQRCTDELLRAADADFDTAHEAANVLAMWTRAMRDWQRGRSVVNIWADIRKDGDHGP